MSEIREMYYPLFWVEESAALEKKYVNQVKNTVLLYVICEFLEFDLTDTECTSI